MHQKGAARGRAVGVPRHPAARAHRHQAAQVHRHAAHAAAQPLAGAGASGRARRRNCLRHRRAYATAAACAATAGAPVCVHILQSRTAWRPRLGLAGGAPAPPASLARRVGGWLGRDAPLAWPPAERGPRPRRTAAIGLEAPELAMPTCGRPCRVSAAELVAQGAEPLDTFQNGAEPCRRRPLQALVLTSLHATSH